MSDDMLAPLIYPVGVRRCRIPPG